MISYIVQGTLDNVANLEFKSPFRMKTREGAHQGGPDFPRESHLIPRAHLKLSGLTWIEEGELETQEFYLG